MSGICETKRETQCEMKCEIKREPKCETKCEIKCDMKCETTCETKCDTTCETKCETICEAKCEIKCEAKWETKCQSKCEVSKTNWAPFPPSPQSSYPTLVGFIGIVVISCTLNYVNIRSTKCISSKQKVPGRMKPKY